MKHRIRDLFSHEPHPVPEPEEEPEEDPETGILPNREKLRKLTRDQRQELVDIVGDWTGENVSTWRQMVRDVDEEEDIYGTST
jgi:hypothetical protein